MSLMKNNEILALLQRAGISVSEDHVWIFGVLYREKILTEEAFSALREYAPDESRIERLIILHKLKMLTQDNFTRFYKGVDEEILNHLFKTIYISDDADVSDHIKIAAFFLACQKDLKNNPSSQKINKLLSEIKSERLRKHLQKILNKMGGYSFMPDKDKNITLGVEVEYSNIPTQYRHLTELVMECIQKGWSHPGDDSVKAFGENAYSGEATTPIIYNNIDLQHAMLNIAFLQAMGGETNDSCGLHVHIGVKNIEMPAEFKYIGGEKKSHGAYQLEFMKQFLNIYKREEAKFNSMERKYNDFCRKIDINDIKDIKMFWGLIQKMNPSSSRYFEVNLLAYYKYGTLEIRRFSGTTEEAQIYATLAMIYAIAQEAKTRTNHIFNNALHEQSVEKNKEENYALLFFAKEKTERQTELFMLRVKAVNEHVLITEKKAPNSVYVKENKGVIEFEAIDRDGQPTMGIIDDVNRFRNVIDKLKSNQALSQQEQNQVLLEVANEGHARVSHRVEKAVSVGNIDNVLKERKNNQAIKQTSGFFALSIKQEELNKVHPVIPSAPKGQLRGIS